MRFKQTDSILIEKAVEGLEKRSAAEIVVVVDAKAGQYRDLEFLVTLFFVFLGLLINVLVPWEIGAWLLLFDTIVIALIGYFFMNLSGAAKLFSSKKRIDDFVDKAACAAFTKYKVHSTKERTGVLIYLAVFENRVQIIADSAIHTFLPKDTWDWWEKGVEEITSNNDSCKALIEHLERLGERLECYLPIRDSDANELPNSPRMQL